MPIANTANPDDKMLLLYLLFLFELYFSSVIDQKTETLLKTFCKSWDVKSKTNQNIFNRNQ